MAASVVRLTASVASATSEVEDLLLPLLALLQLGEVLALLPASPLKAALLQVLQACRR